MKTKIRKSLATILALVMVLSMVSFASAQVFPDIPESLDSAATRLAGLGIIAGYPDGTFRPDNNITRGEFAKIAVIVLGLEKSADLLENVPSNFKDVKVGDWYNKYVNVAANQGILKGYPDGTFKPNSNITQAEALTIVLRLLGYKEDHLPGNWPYNYVTQADRIGLLDAGFDTGLAASRGWVADLVSRALDTATVTWADDEGFKEGKALIDRSFGGQVIEAVRVASALAASTGDTITVVDDDGKETTLNVAANAVINGAAFADLRNHMVDLTTKLVSGKEVVVAVDVLSAKITGEVKAINNFTRVATIGTTEVVFRDGTALPQKGKTITAYIFLGKVYDWEEPREENYGEITDIKFGETNTVTIHVKFEYGPWGPVTNTFTVTKDTIITLNGAKAAITDLASGQYVEYEHDNKVLTKLDAYSNVVFGTLESWEMENSQVTSITVNGVKYSAVKDLNMEGVEIGVIVMLSLNNHNQVYSVLPFGSYASTVIGEFDSLSSRASTEGRVYYIVLKDGTSYDITEAVVAAEKGEEVLFVDLERKMVFTELNVENSMVKICYNAKGEVVAVYVFSSQTIIEKPDEGWNLVGGVPGVPGVPEVLFGKFAQGSTTYSKDGMPTATLVVEGPDVTEVLRYVITWDAESGIAKHIDAITVMNKGTVTGIGSDSRGKYVLINVTKGKAVSGKYYFSEETESFYATLNIYDEIEFTFKDAEDMWTGFGQDTIKKLNYLKVTKYAEPGTPPPSSGGPEEPTGTVTYIDTTNEVIYVDNTPYQCGNATRLLTSKGNIIAIGFTNISAALAVDDEVKDIVLKNGVIDTFVATKVASIQAVVTPVDTQIEALPAVDAADATILAAASSINTAKSAYDGLAPYQKDFVKPANVTKLNALVAKLAQLQDAQAAATVDTQIEALPAVDAADATILAAASNITAAKTAYDNLTPAQKALVKPANVTKLNALVAKLAQLQDAQTVATAKANLAIGYTSGDDANNVNGNLTLPTTQDGATVTWSSSHPEIVKADGTVTRPYGADVQVTLTATITKGTASDTKVFIVTVKGQ